MAFVTELLAVDPVLAARGRGIARLIEGLSEGDPVSWSITGIVVAIMVGTFIFKRTRGAS